MQTDTSRVNRNASSVSDAARSGNVLIEKWSRCEHTDRMLAELDAVFFAASATTTFPNEGARAAFRERWLGRYLTYDPGWAYIARAPSGAVAGYLVASPEDAARSERFADISYFAGFAHLTAAYSVQLHVNLASKWRGQGIGSRLIETLAADAGAAGLAGIHAISSRGMRNVGFYLANGFHEAGTQDWNGRELVFLARRVLL